MLSVSKARSLTNVSCTLISNVAGYAGVEDHTFLVCVSRGVDATDTVESSAVVHMVRDFLEPFGESLRKRECGRVCMATGKAQGWQVSVDDVGCI